MASTQQFIPNVIRINKIVINNFKGKSVDLTDMVREINIFENIYSNCIIGSLDIIDSHDYPQTFPLIGEESVLIDILLPNLSDSENLKLENFRIFQITDRVITNDKIQHYKLWFTSPEAITSFETKVCKAWKSVPTTKIVKDVFNILQSKRKLEIDETIGITSYISTNFSPLQIFNYLASNRSINSLKLSDYAFFENINTSNPSTGTKFNFKSLGKLSSIKSGIKFTYNPVTMSDGTDNSFAANIQPFNIGNIDFNKGFNLLESKTAGLYNQTFIYYDILRKRHVVQKLGYDDIFSESGEYRLEGEKSNKMFTNNTNTYGESVNFIYSTTFPSLVSNNKEIGNIYNKGKEDNTKRANNNWISGNGDSYDTSSMLVEETIHRRKVLLQEYEINKIFLNDVSGNYKYTIGTTVEFLKPHIVFNKDEVTKKMPNGNNGQDSLISGFYLITKSRHRIFRDETSNWRYLNYLEISKNTFKTDLSKIQ